MQKRVHFIVIVKRIEEFLCCEAFSLTLSKCERYTSNTCIYAEWQQQRRGHISLTVFFFASCDSCGDKSNGGGALFFLNMMLGFSLGFGSGLVTFCSSAQKIITN